LLNFLEQIDTIDENAEAALAAAARIGKEPAYLEQLGRPQLPFQRERREAYGYEEQSPSDHIKYLERYLLIASSLFSENSALHHFRIRHPDLQPSNVIVSKSSDSNRLKIVGLLDWQHASIRPPFLLAGIPGRLQKYDDPVSQGRRLPSHPHCRRIWTSWTNPSRATRWDSTTAVSSTSITSRTRRSTTSSITMRCRTPCSCSSPAFSTNPVLHEGETHALKTPGCQKLDVLKLLWVGLGQANYNLSKLYLAAWKTGSITLVSLFILLLLVIIV
jgi:hypothetical protein